MDTRKKTIIAIRSEERRLVWECINETFNEVQKWADKNWDLEYSEDIDLEFAIYNRADHAIYSTLSRKGQKLEFAIFDDGFMAVCLQEACHKKRAYELVAANEVPDIDWNRLKKDISLLLKGFLLGNWHEIMDYLSNGIEWQDCFKSYFEENGVFPRGNSITYIM